jgi:hypothetical protein
MKYQSCRTCGFLQPLAEPHYSLYAGLQTRKRWKKVCNKCIASADARRGHPQASTDHRDYRHPLEEVVRAWVQQ